MLSLKFFLSFCFQLSPQEKELVLDAKKTAEFYDSQEKVKHEAVRIARMLRAAQYAIVFTGDHTVFFVIFKTYCLILISPVTLVKKVEVSATKTILVVCISPKSPSSHTESPGKSEHGK